MTSAKKSVEAKDIRAEIAKIPAAELATAKPKRILPLLKAAGFEITNSVKSQTSRLLGEAKAAKEKEKSDKSPSRIVVTSDPAAIPSQEVIQSRELAMQLVEACGGDFDWVRAEISRLEQFAKSIKGT